MYIQVKPLTFSYIKPDSNPKYHHTALLHTCGSSLKKQYRPRFCQGCATRSSRADLFPYHKSDSTSSNLKLQRLQHGLFSRARIYSLFLSSRLLKKKRLQLKVGGGYPPGTSAVVHDVKGLLHGELPVGS